MVRSPPRPGRAASTPPPFVAHCQELLGTLGPVRARRMFGGWGLYADGLMVALIAYDRLYLKTDDGSRGQFAAAGCEAFVYEGGGRRVVMSYWTPPAEALDAPPLMAPWARLALQAALRVANSPVKTPGRKAAKSPSRKPSAGNP